MQCLYELLFLSIENYSMRTNDRKELKCKTLNNTNNLHKSHFIITVIICQVAAKPRYKSSSSYPEEKQNEQLKYSKPVQPQDKDLKEYEATSAKKTYQETLNSDSKRKRKLPSRSKRKFPSMYREKKHRRRGESPRRHYDLGSRSGYRWMLYGSPLQHHYNYHPEYPHKQRSKAYWRRYGHHIARESAFYPPHRPARHVVYGHGRSVDERPIVVSIHPTFKAYNMRSASVLGYGLDSLLHDVVLATKLHRIGYKKTLYDATKGKNKES